MLGDGVQFPVGAPRIDQMNLYRIGYGSHEDCPHVTLFHETEYTQEGFEEICLEASVAVVKRRIGHLLLDAPRLLDFGTQGKKRLNGDINNFDDIFEDVAKELVEEHGFKDVKFRGTVKPFGWCSILDKSDWNEDERGRGEFVDKLTDLLNEEGFSREHDSFLYDKDI